MTAEGSCPDCPLDRDRCIYQYTIGDMMYRTHNCCIYDATRDDPRPSEDNKYVFKYICPLLPIDCIENELLANSVLTACPNAAIGFDSVRIGHTCGFFMKKYQRRDLWFFMYENSLTEDQVAIMSRRILEALAYMHRSGYAHRDLKPENILLHGDGAIPDTYIADFGHAASCRQGPLKGLLGTADYRAPEILLRRPYGTAVDMWAFGVTLYRMFTREFPFLSEEDVMWSVPWDQDELVRMGASDKFCDLIDRCLEQDPEQRITAEEALLQPFYEGIDADREKAAILSTVEAFDMPIEDTGVTGE